MQVKYFVTLFLFIFYGFLYSFGGRPINIEEVRPYYTAADKVRIDVYIYSNLGANTNYNYLTFTIADAIANQLDYNKTLKLQTETNLNLTPMDFERAYDYKVFQFTNITYTAIERTNENNENIVTNIVTNYEYTYYTNWGGVRSNVKYVGPESKHFFLNEDEIIVEYNGSNVIVRNTNDFLQEVDIGSYYYEYFGEDIKKYVFTRDSDIAIFGTVEFDRPNIIIVTYVAYIKERKINSYKVELSESTIDEQIPLYALDIANRISHLDKTGVVAINVEPPNSFIYIDNILMGISGDTLYIPALTTNSHRFTIKKDLYETIDTMLAFEKSGEDIELNFSLSEMTNIARVQIEIPGGEESAVIINGIKEEPMPYIDRNFGFGTYSIKITNSNYVDYYGLFTIESTNSLFLKPTMKQFKEPTLVDRIFKNYERNTKIFLGLTIASGIFTVGSYIFANEILDKTMVNYYEQYGNSYNRPPIDLRNYNTAFNMYIAGMVITSAFALTTGVYYMLWINENNFTVEKLAFNMGFGGANLAYSYCW